MTREEARNYMSSSGMSEEQIRTIEQAFTCEDAISRQAVLDALAIGEEFLKRVLDEVDVLGHEREKYEWGLGLVESCISDMKDLPSVTPPPKRGHWIPTYGNVKCSVCGSVKDSRKVGKATHYCDFCGAKMAESEEE